MTMLHHWLLHRLLHHWLLLLHGLLHHLLLWCGHWSWCFFWRWGNIIPSHFELANFFIFIFHFEPILALICCINKLTFNLDFSSTNKIFFVEEIDIYNSNSIEITANIQSSSETERGSLTTVICWFTFDFLTLPNDDIFWVC